MKKTLLILSSLAASVMANAQVYGPYPIMKIDSVQFVNAAKLANATANTFPDYINPVFRDSVYRDTVRFEGIVVSNPQMYGLSTSRKAAYLQRKGGGPWGGIMVMCEPSGTGLTLAQLNTETKFYQNFVPGNTVRVTGVIRDFQGETQVNLIKNDANFLNSVEVLSLGPDTAIYTEITADKLMKGNPNTGWVQQKSTAEQYEGSMVLLRNVSVYSITTSGLRSFWNVIDDFGNVIDVRDFSAYYRRDDNEDTVPKIANTFQPPPIGTRLEFIRGVVTEYAASGVPRYGISPLYPGDYKVCTSCPPVIKYISRNPIISKISDTTNIVVEITVGDTTLAFSKLYYRKPGGSTIDSVNLTAVTGFPNYYVGSILPTGVAGPLNYWVGAVDKKGRYSIYPDPFTIGKSIYITTNGVQSIATLQFSNNSAKSTIWDGDSLLNINVGGIVTGKGFTAGSTNLITVQNGTGPNSAIFVQKSPGDGTDSWQVGDSVNITRATVRESFNVTTLNSVVASVASSGNPLPPFAMNLPIDSFATNRVGYAREWEAVLVKWDSVRVTNKNPDDPNQNGEFAFHKDTTKTGLRVDDMNIGLRNLNTKLQRGIPMTFLQGAMYFSFGNFKVIPRGLSDLGMTIDTIAPMIKLKGNQYDTILLNRVYVDSGATAYDSIDGDITSKITKTGTVNHLLVGNYTITYNVADNWNNTATATRYVYVKLNTSISEQELMKAITLYPSPANNSITIEGTGLEVSPARITILDLVGREVASAKARAGSARETVDVSGLQSGVYFCVISSDKGTRSIKFVVTGK